VGGQTSLWLGLRARCGGEWTEHGEEEGCPKHRLLSWKGQCSSGLTASEKSYKGSFLDSFKEQTRLPWSLFMSSGRSPDDPINVSGVGCDAVPHHGWLVQVIKTDMFMVLASIEQPVCRMLSWQHSWYWCLQY
jgi:hypothetical protein